MSPPLFLDFQADFLPRTRFCKPVFWVKKAGFPDNFTSFVHLKEGAGMKSAKLR
jgi:hypothetical protein